MQIATDLKKVSLIQKELEYTRSDEFKNFTKEIVFLNCFKRSFSNQESSLYFSTSYRDGIFDIITSSVEPTEDTFLELHFVNTREFIENMVCKSFFDTNAVNNGMRVSLFNSFILAKYGKTLKDDIKHYYNIDELLDWNAELINIMILEARDNFATSNVRVAMLGLFNYYELLNANLRNIINSYESKKNNFLNGNII